MTVLSKFVAGTLGHRILEANCHEVMHTWKPGCTEAILDAAPEGFKFSFKTYFMFYLVTNLVSKRDPRKIEWKRFFVDVIRSSVFLTSNLVFMQWFYCRIRHLLGFFTLPTLGYTNGILSSLVAICIEKPSRRPALALYLTNLASETLYTQLVNHGYLKFIPGGTFIPFSIGLAILMYLKRKNSLHKQMDWALGQAVRDREKAMFHGSLIRHLPPAVTKFLEELRTKWKKTEHCDHDNSCAYNASARFTHNFGIGLLVSSVLSLVQNFKRVAKNPLKIPGVLLSSQNMKLPLFLGLMPLLYHSSRCAMNRLFPTDNTVRDVSSAFIGGIAMGAFNNSSIAMFTMWKAFEALYGHLVELGYLKWVKYGDIVLYGISTGYVLGCAAVEPHAVRKGYMHFLNGLTGNRISMFNRKFYDFYGFQSSKMYGDNAPKLDPRHVTPSLFIPQ